MLKINGQNILLTRGDTAHLNFVPVNADGSERVSVEGDNAYFRLRANSVIEKSCVITLGSSVIQLELVPNDTINLPYGTYPYEVELVTGEHEHYTFISGGYFTVDTEIEEHNNE